SDARWSTTGRSTRTASRTARGRPPTLRKFSVMTSNQSARLPCSSTSGKCLVRSPMPWPRKGTMVSVLDQKSTPEPSTPRSGAVRLRRLNPGRLLLGDDLPALVGALLLGLGRDPALALAAVLAAAAMATARARARALAGVDSGTLHVAAGLVVPRGGLVRCVCGGGGEHRAHGRGDE